MLTRKRASLQNGFSKTWILAVLSTKDWLLRSGSLALSFFLKGVGGHNAVFFSWFRQAATLLLEIVTPSISAQSPRNSPVSA